MGIHGIFKEIGQGQRVSLAKISADHYVAHNRPFRLAIDISIWLFQIQAGKGGSNPALRTFYYRLLRLLSLNIHPLFVFDGPNKPLFKRNKRVGGPGVRVANIPEFLAKQLLKQFGIPQHVAPGEAEAECALLQNEGIVDGVLSEDVDTLMFGSGMTLRNWTSENTTKSPTHVNVYYADQTKETSGLDREGMILVALMSGGDYITEGIPRCGPKNACDAARANFGHDLCALKKDDVRGLESWKERLQHELRTNESKFFGRKNRSIIIPESFPDPEVLRYYTHPCVSSPEKLDRLRQELTWDQEIDFAALRVFTADAFDWRCLSGAKKFIKNLAPTILVRELRLRSQGSALNNLNSQKESEQTLVKAIHGKRHHLITDGTLEYRVSFIPSALVPIDLSVEEEDDDNQVIGPDGDEESDAEKGTQPADSNTALADVQSEPKKKVFKPYYPDQPEKLWIICAFLQLGSPLLIEDYEAGLKVPTKSKKSTRQKGGRQHNNVDESYQLSILPYTRITKQVSSPDETETSLSMAKGASINYSIDVSNKRSSQTATFTLPSTQVPRDLFTRPRNGRNGSNTQVQPPSITETRNDRPFAAFSSTQGAGKDIERTPRRKKRASSEIQSPCSKQKPITTFFSPSTGKFREANATIVDLTSSPISVRCNSADLQASKSANEDSTVAMNDSVFREPPDTVTKRRRKAPLRRWRTEPLPTDKADEDDLPEFPVLLPSLRSQSPEGNRNDARSEVLDLVSSSPARSDRSLPSPTSFMRRCLRDGSTIGFPIRETEEENSASSGAKATASTLRSPFRNEVRKELDHQPSPTMDANEQIPAADLLSGSPGNNTRLDMLDKRPHPIRSPVAEISPNERSLDVAKPKSHIQIRESLSGTWKECSVEADMIDMTGDRSDWKPSRSRIKTNACGKRQAWRKSAVEVLDLTGD